MKVYHYKELIRIFLEEDGGLYNLPDVVFMKLCKFDEEDMGVLSCLILTLTKLLNKKVIILS